MLVEPKAVIAKVLWFLEYELVSWCSAANLVTYLHFSKTGICALSREARADWARIFCSRSSQNDDTGMFECLPSPERGWFHAVHSYLSKIARGLGKRERAGKERGLDQPGRYGLYPHLNILSFCVLCVHLLFQVQLTPEAAHEKDRLLESFYQWAKAVCKHLQSDGNWADFIDPCSGYPVLFTLSFKTILFSWHGNPLFMTSLLQIMYV